MSSRWSYIDLEPEPYLNIRLCVELCYSATLWLYWLIQVFLYIPIDMNTRCGDQPFDMA